MLRFLVSLVTLAACTTRPPPSGRLSLTDDAGVTVALAGPARRIVSLIPASTELLFALGAGDRVVGRTTWCDYPPEAARIPSVGDGLNPNVEAVLARQPDLVVLYESPSNHGAAERFRDLGLSTIELALNRVADFERAARILGQATGRELAADHLIRQVRAGLDSATVRSARAPNVLLLAWQQPPMTLGRGSFLSELVERAGGRNIFDDLAVPSAVIGIEAVVQRDPDLVLVAEAGDPGIAARPEWRVVRAVRQRRFVHAAGSEFSRPSPRMPDAVRRLARAFAEIAR